MRICQGTRLEISGKPEPRLSTRPHFSSGQAAIPASRPATEQPEEHREKLTPLGGLWSKARPLVSVSNWFTPPGISRAGFLNALSQCTDHGSGDAISNLVDRPILNSIRGFDLRIIRREDL